METTGIWDSRNNRHATVEHETLEPCPFCGGNMPGRYVPIDPSFQTRVTCLYSAVEKWNRRG